VQARLLLCFVRNVILFRDYHVTWNEGECDSARVMKEDCREAKVAQLMRCQLLGHTPQAGPDIRGLNLGVTLKEDSEMCGYITD
jgi:hypothetical protein